MDRPPIIWALPHQASCLPLKGSIRLHGEIMESVETLKAKLDKDIESVDSNDGILFGEELFAEFKNCGWLTLEIFGIFGA